MVVQMLARAPNAATASFKHFWARCATMASTMAHMATADSVAPIGLRAAAMASSINSTARRATMVSTTDRTVHAPTIANSLRVAAMASSKKATKSAMRAKTMEKARVVPIAESSSIDA